MINSEGLAVRIRQQALVVALVFGTASAASAQLSFEHHPKKNPYRNLFGERGPVQRPTAPLRGVSRRAPQKPTVVCGTMIVPADPTIDPKMRVKPPSQGVEHKLRIVKPPICKPE